MAFTDYLASFQVLPSGLQNSTMDFSSLLNYVNPFACPISVLEEFVLENRWMCCMFWYMHDHFNTIVERRCGADAVGQLEMSLDMMIPLARERCPGNANGGFGCKMAMQAFLLYILFWVGVFTWSIVITIKWLRVRRQLRLALYSPDDKEQNAKLLPDAVQVELQPIKNGLKNGLG